MITNFLFGVPSTDHMDNAVLRIADFALLRAPMTTIVLFDSSCAI